MVSQAPNKPDTNSIYQQIGELSLSAWDKPIVSAALSGDYTFTNTFYIHTEILYNNRRDRIVVKLQILSFSSQKQIN